MTIRELGTVTLSRNIEEHGLRQGDVGTVVQCYANHDAFEVEFVTEHGETIAVLTLTQADIRTKHNKK